jgi:hypothetical protein
MRAATTVAASAPLATIACKELTTLEGTELDSFEATVEICSPGFKRGLLPNTTCRVTWSSAHTHLGVSPSLDNTVESITSPQDTSSGPLVHEPPEQIRTGLLKTRTISLKLFLNSACIRRSAAIVVIVIVVVVPGGTVVVVATQFGVVPVKKLLAAHDKVVGVPTQPVAHWTEQLAPYVLPAQSCVNWLPGGRPSVHCAGLHCGAVPTGATLQELPERMTLQTNALFGSGEV